MRAILGIAMSLPLLAGTAVLDGGKVYYASVGKGARTVVLIHGWTCDHTF
jgi:pimeloyl-ACP methyl ester carboxylesterase